MKIKGDTICKGHERDNTILASRKATSVNKVMQ